MSTNFLPCTIRLPDYMFKQLNAIARQKGISFHLLMLQILQHALDYDQGGAG